MQTLQLKRITKQNAVASFIVNNFEFHPQLVVS